MKFSTKEMFTRSEERIQFLTAEERKRTDGVLGIFQGERVLNIDGREVICWVLKTDNGLRLYPLNTTLKMLHERIRNELYEGLTLKIVYVGKRKVGKRYVDDYEVILPDKKRR